MLGFGGFVVRFVAVVAGVWLVVVDWSFRCGSFFYVLFGLLVWARTEAMAG